MTEQQDPREPYLTDLRYCMGCGVTEFDATMTECDPHGFMHCEKCKCPQCADDQQCIFCNRRVADCICPDDTTGDNWTE